MTESISSDFERKAREYNYEHFSLAGRNLDRLEGVREGESAPDFTATRLDGSRVRLSDYRGKIVVLEAGSITCPMYERGIDRMNALAYRFPDVAFLVLYTREAHPGENLGPHRSMADKTDAARRVADTDREGRTMLVDDLQGSAHQHYGMMPNTVHIIDSRGVVVFRSMWNDPAVVEQALRQVRQGSEPSALRLRFRPAPPHVLFRVLRRAGWQALRDFAVAFPKVALEHLKPSRERSRPRVRLSR
ncbi:peroxiredoxin family protein [Streptomyces gobiensis]|uniref:peroxiredoxin family protein n=1 Tax=Streptomyces gobiensis TaxID=2875706 RepID=UPI001E4DA1C2|nr:deiodinase-like protein [Streptomyces gobiensis]UGY93443.1 redoxin domain-containing protein [Streptomyces gobiensis]